MVYFLFAFFVIGAMFMTWKAVQLWKDATLIDQYMDTLAFLPFGKAVKRGETRSLALTAASLWGISSLVLLGVTETDLTGLRLGVFMVGLLTVLVSLLLEVAVVLFNAPKFVVPPHMRSDPGVIAGRRVRGN